jgi:hypothetical protein
VSIVDYIRYTWDCGIHRNDALMMMLATRLEPPLGGWGWREQGHKLGNQVGLRCPSVLQGLFCKKNQV